MKTFVNIPKLQKYDKVAILSPSFAAPGAWPDVYELGLSRLRNVFNLEPVEFPTTKKVGASKVERTKDLIAAFENKEIKAVIASLGGDDQVTYIKDLPSKPFKNNPKPFFGYSDNTHFMNFLWLNSIPSFYGATLFTQFAEPGKINEFTVNYLNIALFNHGKYELKSSDKYSDIGLDWDDSENLKKQRIYESNEGWSWDKNDNVKGITWGGCLESIDQLLKHKIAIPSLKDFENVILLTETSEEIPDPDYVSSVYKEMGEKGILEKIKAVLVGRPKAWEFDNQKSKKEKEVYRKIQIDTILKSVRKYNANIPVIQNLDFGHTEPQIPIPYGGEINIDSENKKIFANV